MYANTPNLMHPATPAPSLPSVPAQLPTQAQAAQHSPVFGATLPQQSQAPMHSPVFGATPEAVANLHAKMGQGYDVTHLPPSYASGNIGATGMPHRWNQVSGRATDYQPIIAPTNGAQPFAGIPSPASGIRTGGPLANG